jgi:hypothetical protein
MKRMILFLPLLFVMVVFASPAANGMTEQPRMEQAVVEFTETVKLQGVLLRGQYLVYHDDNKTAEGEPYLYLYPMKNGMQDKLVVALHCEPVKRDRAVAFTVKLSPRRHVNGVREVVEIQFAGMAKGHKIPG